MNENNKNSGIGLYRVYSGDIVIPKKLPIPGKLSDRRLHNMIDDIVRKHPERYERCFHRREGDGFLHEVEGEGISDTKSAPFTLTNNPYSIELASNRSKACQNKFYKAFMVHYKALRDSK